MPPEEAISRFQMMDALRQIRGATQMSRFVKASANKPLDSSMRHGGRYSLGFGGGRSRALHCEVKPPRPWEPSQKGLFSANPQRHKERTLRPPSPYSLPSESAMMKSPSMRIGPLFTIVTFVAIKP